MEDDAPIAIRERGRRTRNVVAACAGLLAVSVFGSFALASAPGAAGLGSAAIALALVAGVVGAMVALLGYDLYRSSGRRTGPVRTGLPAESHP